MVLGGSRVTQCEPMSVFLRIQGRESCTFSLGSLAGEEQLENTERPTQKLFDSLDHPLKLFSYRSP